MITGTLLFDRFSSKLHIEFIIPPAFKQHSGTERKQQKTLSAFPFQLRERIYV